MFFGEKKLVALDIGTSNIKLAEITQTRKGPHLSKFGVYPIAPGQVSGGEIVDTAGISDAIRALFKASKAKGKFVCTGMWGTSVIVRKISMPRMERNLVAEQIRWEAEQYIPFDINEISLDHHILSRSSSGAESMDVLLVAAKQEFLFRMIEAIEGSGLKCSIIDVSGFALANCFEANYGSVGGLASIVNIGSGVTNIVVIENGEVVFSRDLPIGGANYTSDINKAMGVSLDEAEALKISASLGQEVPDEVNGIMASTTEQVVDEIRKGFEFFSASMGGMMPNRLFLTGGSIFVPGLVDQLSQSLRISYEIFDPFLRVTYDKRVVSKDYLPQVRAMSSVVIGLALRRLNEK